MPARRARPGARPARRRRTRRRPVPATAAPIARPPRRVVEQVGERRRPPRGGRRGGATTTPGHAVDDGLGGAARVAGDLRHAARRRLDEHDAEALLLEPAPPVAAQHREHVGAAVQRAAGRRCGTRPRKRTGASSSVGQRGAAGARRGRRRRSPAPGRGGAGAASAAARMATSKPLRGTSRRIADDQLGVGRQAEVRRARPDRSSSSSGRKRSVSTPGGTTVIGSVAPGGALGLGGRVRRRPATMWRARAQHVAERLPVPGQPAGHGDLGAVQHHVVGQLRATGRRARAARPGRARRGRHRTRRPAR